MACGGCGRTPITYTPNTVVNHQKGTTVGVIKKPQSYRGVIKAPKPSVAGNAEPANNENKNESQ